jgi:hypothetical protein
LEVFFGVYADGVEVRGFNVEAETVFEEAELLQALGRFEWGWGEGGEAVEGGLAVGVEAEVFPVGDGAGGVAVVGDGGAGEVEGAAVEGGDDFDGVGVGDVLFGAGNFEGGDVHVRMGEGAQERADVVRVEEGFVALDVDVDVCRVELGYGVDAVGPAGEGGRGHFHGPVIFVAEIGYFIGVGGDEDMVKLGAGAGRLDDPGEHGPTGDFAEDLAGKTGGGEAGGDDAEDCGLCLLFQVVRFQYDDRGLWRGDTCDPLWTLMQLETPGGVAQMVRATDS